MKATCVVANCCSRKRAFEKGVSFHRIYRNGEYEQKWIYAIRSLNGQEIQYLSRDMVICNKHFERVFQRNVGKCIKLLPNAVPTIFPNSNKKENTLNNEVNLQCSSSNLSSNGENIASPLDIEIVFFNNIEYSPEECILPENTPNEGEHLNQPSTSRHMAIEEFKDEYISQSPENTPNEGEHLNQPSTSRHMAIEEFKDEYISQSPENVPNEGEHLNQPSTSRHMAMEEFEDEHISQSPENVPNEGEHLNQPSTSRHMAMEEFEDEHISQSPENVPNEGEHLSQPSPSTSQHMVFENVCTDFVTIDSVPAEGIEIEFLDQSSTSNWRGGEIEDQSNADNNCRHLVPSTPKNTNRQTNNIRKTLRQINEEATPQTLRKLNCSLIERLKKKTKALKSSQRKVQRKNKKIQSLTALVFELKNRIMICENAV